MELIKDGRPSMAGLVVIQKEKIYVYADMRPRDYDWDISEATDKEKDYLLRCMIKNQWLPE